MQLSGAQIVVQSLKAEGVEYVFGFETLHDDLCA